MSLDVAALAEPLSVVLHAFRRARLQPGARVLILGAGAVGLLACSLARASGCTSVVAVDIEQAKLDFAAQMGWASGTYALPRGPRVSGFEALEVAKSGWEGLKAHESVTSVEGLSEGFDAVFECTGVESCMQLAPMVSFGRVPGIAVSRSPAGRRANPPVIEHVAKDTADSRPRSLVGKSSSSGWERPTSSSPAACRCSEK